MDIALGILNISVSESRTADRRALVELARSRGYHLGEVLIVDDDTYMPTAYIAERARTVGAGAILAPSLEHFGVAARALPYVCALVVPEPAVSTYETGRGGPVAATRSRGRHRLRRPVISVAALAVFLAVIWALWPAPDSVPIPAVVVTPEPATPGGGDQFRGANGDGHSVIDRTGRRGGGVSGLADCGVVIAERIPDRHNARRGRGTMYGMTTTRKVHAA